MDKKIKVEAINEYIKVAMRNEREREEGIVTDPQGSYTGVSREDPLERPIQDADDL